MPSFPPGSECYPPDKKEELTLEKTVNKKLSSLPGNDKKEELSYSYYMIKAKDIQLIPLVPEVVRDKKEELRA